MSEQHVPDFEDRVRALLAHAAEAIPAETDLTERVRQAHARDDLGRRGGAARSRHVLATVAAVVVVALLAGVLTFVHPGGAVWPIGRPTATATAPSPQVVVPPVCVPPGPPSNPTPPAGTPVDHSVAVGRRASHHGITITIDRVYADATQTVITYHMQTTLNPPFPAAPILIDAQGHRYGMLWAAGTPSGGGNVIFNPLPPEELGTPQTLTFFTQQMQPANSTGPGAMVDGPWQIPFRLTPTAGTSVALRNAPVTRNGLTIQPLRLDLAPAGGGLDGATGGARVCVRFSGLAPGMHLTDLPNFGTFFDLGGGSSAALGVGTLVLVLQGGQQIVPGVVYPLGQIVPATPAEEQAPAAQTVGPSGTADVEALFYVPLPAGTSVTLYLDHVPAQLAGAAALQPISGPWAFRLSTGA
jgi:hypothetical protein